MSSDDSRERDWRGIALQRMARSLIRWTESGHFDTTVAGLGRKMKSDDLTVEDVIQGYSVTEEFYELHHTDLVLATDMPDDVADLLDEGTKLFGYFIAAARDINNPDETGEAELRTLENAFTESLGAARDIGALIEERHTVTTDGVPPEYYEHANTLSATGAGKNPLSGPSPDYERARQLLTEMQQMVTDAARRHQVEYDA